MCMLIKCNLFIVRDPLRITSFLTQGLEKESVNHLCCYNETNDNKSQRESVSSQTEIVGKEVSVRPAYRSSKKVKDYDKLEAEVKKNRRMISFKETLLRTSSSFCTINMWNLMGQCFQYTGNMLVLKKSRALFMMIWRSRHEKYDLI
ncbi:hypothetical protein IGI04_039776 [Brassica rapa subsp. trilocularis]|uniref:Uncharacterized protein n=1 Tax=Brassica rapa subsp. trilocularis TaxID=1813537 RepID=A0ABQ7KKV6_BRACM|nr:hypothetical protein IGI04_039776 [Brassica rapa subsp. trilocularis]